MSELVEAVAEAVAMEVEDPVVTMSEVPVAVSRELVAQLVGDAQRQGLSVEGEHGLLAELTRLVLESALDGEIADHLGYDKHEKGGSVDGNARNGTRPKTVLTKAGPVTIEVPRDRAGTFERKVVAKRQRRLGSIEDIVLSEVCQLLDTPQYPAVVKLWEKAWAEFVQFLGFDREIRRIVCTTNAIESVNARIRKAVRARGHFPNEQAALKCVYLAVMALDPTGKGRARWTQRWKGALNAFDIRFDGRLSSPRA